MLYYPTQLRMTLIGSKAGTTRTSSALTTDYADNAKSIKTGGFSKLNLDVLYTMGATESSNSIELKVEGSPDGTNFYRIANEAVSGGTSTLTAREFTFVGVNAAAATISIGLDIFYKYVKVSAKETGVASNAGTAYIEATLSGK
jgi:hypothetical protein